MSVRKKEIIVRHRMMNGKEIMLQRKVRRLGKLFFAEWRDWKLLNQPLYDIDEGLLKKLKEIEADLYKRREEEEFLAHQVKEIDASTRQTRGYSMPFKMKVKVTEIPFKSQKWGSPVDDKWRKGLSPQLLKRTGGGKGGGDKGGGFRIGPREKMDLPDHPGMGNTTAYLDKDFSALRYSLNEMDGIDTVMEFREESKKDKNKQKNKQKNRQNQQHNQERSMFDES